MNFPIVIEANLTLKPLEEQDAAALLAAIEHNREHLDPWLRWSGRIKTMEDALNLIRRFSRKLADNDGFHAGMWRDGQLIGGMLCHHIKHESRKTEIGYWLTHRAVGHGYVTRASRALIEQFFHLHNIHRIEIQCATDNVRSRAVAQRLGFTFEGVLRESEWLTTRFADHAVYSLLHHEWVTAQA